MTIDEYNEDRVARGLPPIGNKDPKGRPIKYIVKITPDIGVMLYDESELED